MFSRKNSLLGIYRKSIDVLLGIVEERTYYCLSSSENRYAVPGIPMKYLHERQVVIDKFNLWLEQDGETKTDVSDRLLRKVFAIE